MSNSITQSEFLNKSRNTILTDSGSIMISQLKTKIFELEQNEKSYDQLYSKYKSIQLENNQLTEKNIQYEYQIRQLTESSTKSINDAKAKTISLTEELKQKMTTNKTLYNSNVSLNNTIEELDSKIESMTQMIKDKDIKHNESIIILNNTNAQEKQKMTDEISQLKNKVNELTKQIKAHNDIILTTEKKEKELNEVIQHIKEESNATNTTLNKERKRKEECESEIEKMPVN